MSQVHLPPNRTHGPLPHDSSFVQAARENIPQTRVRVTTATSRGRLRGRGRGRTTTPQEDAVKQPSTGTHRGTIRKRHQTDLNGHQQQQTQGTGIGAYYLLFGDDGQQQQQTPSGDAVHDLNADVLPDLNTHDV